jgi:hypothetical protein
LINTTRANGVVVLSGDVHYGEVSALLPGDDSDPSGAAATTAVATEAAVRSSSFSSAHPPASRDGVGYPLLDATASGLTEAESWFFVPPNAKRVAGTSAVSVNHWGRLSIDFDATGRAEEKTERASAATSAAAGRSHNGPVVVRLKLLNAAGEAPVAVARPLSDLKWG